MSAFDQARPDQGGGHRPTVSGLVRGAWRRLGVLSMVGVLACMAAVVTAVGLYQFKHEAQERRERIAVLRADIASERAAIDLLYAEWTFLNRPERIQALAERFLNLKPFTMEQVIAVDALAIRPQPKPMTIEDILNAAR